MSDNLKKEEPKMDFTPLSPEQPVRWATMIPLIGGSALGCEKASGSLPLFHLSYAAFAANEAHLQRHWPSVPMFRLDTGNTAATTDSLKQILAGGDIDFVNSVCPCAGLSMLNTSVKGPSGRGSDAKQNEWMLKSAEFVLGQVRPKVLWGENAPGLFMTLGEAMVPRLRELGERHGYSFSMVKTNTQLHGLPQQRMRTFYFFWRSATAPMLEWVTREAPHLHDYLRTIPAWASYQDIPVVEGAITQRFKPYQFVLAKEGLDHQQFVQKHATSGPVITLSKYLEKHNLIDECLAWLHQYYPNAKWSLKSGGSSRTFIDYLEHMKAKLARGMGYWDDSPKFMTDHFTAVITKNVHFAAHPSEDRFFNIRELMHLMGMPHEFQVDNPARNWNHICQNVPVNTAADWAKQVVKFCRGELEMTAFSFLKQDNCQQRIVDKEVGKVEIKRELVDPETDVLANMYRHMGTGAAQEAADDKNDIKEVKIKEEPVTAEDDAKTDVLKAALKLTFNSDFGNFLTSYKQDEAATEIKESPSKKIKTENTDFEEQIPVAVVKPPAPAAGPPQVQTEAGPVYRCGVCYRHQSPDKLSLSHHLASCSLEASMAAPRVPGAVLGCGRCRHLADSRQLMVDHWITACGRSDLVTPSL